MLVAAVERLSSVGSTNDVVRDRLAAGAPALQVVVADVQTAGRGREGRSWQAPPGRALLLSVGFRPTWLPPADGWRLGAVVALAMADAAEEIAGLRDGTVRLKWPNDLVVEAADGSVRKLAGVLGETSGLGTAEATAIVGIGVNADWPAGEFPPPFADSMTSLREASGGRPIDREILLQGFLGRLELRLAAVRDGDFDAGAWFARQLTNDRLVRIERPDGGSEVARAVGVDPATGALLVVDAGANEASPSAPRAVTVGEIQHLRLADAADAADAAERADAATIDTAETGV